MRRMGDNENMTEEQGYFRKRDIRVDHEGYRTGNRQRCPGSDGGAGVGDAKEIGGDVVIGRSPATRRMTPTTRAEPNDLDAREGTC